MSEDRRVEQLKRELRTERQARSAVGYQLMVAVEGQRKAVALLTRIVKEAS